MIESKHLSANGENSGGCEARCERTGPGAGSHQNAGGQSRSCCRLYASNLPIFNQNMLNGSLLDELDARSCYGFGQRL